MAEPSKKTVRIYDHPQTRIHFLETVLGANGWEAQIYHPSKDWDGQGKHPLAPLQTAFKGTSYDTALTRDDSNNAILSVRRFGTEQNLVDSIREMGLTRGVAHVFQNFGNNFGRMLADFRGFLKEVKESPARLVGGLYIVGDMLLSLSGLGNAKQEQTVPESENITFIDRLRKNLKPEDFLQSVAGLMAFSQSSIFLFWGKKGNQIAFENLFRDAKTALQEGKAVQETHYAPVADKLEEVPLVGEVVKSIKRDPITRGAQTQQLGGAALISSAFIRMFQSFGIKNNPESTADQRKVAAGNIKGAVGDILTGLCSATGWQILQKEGTDTANPYKFPDPRWVAHEFDARPERIAGVFNTSASVFGLIAGSSKSNPIQLAANATYLIGDATMFFVKNKAHGTKANADELIAMGGAEFLEKFPVVFGRKGTELLVENLSKYLAEMTIEEREKEGKLTDAEKQKPRQQLIEEKAADLKNAIKAEMIYRSIKTQGSAEIFYKVISQFPKTEEAAKSANLVTEDEARRKILGAVSSLSSLPQSEVSPEAVRERLQQISEIFPDAARASSIDSLTDIVFKAVAETKLDTLAIKVAELAASYPAEQRDEVVATVSKWACASKQVVADEEELIELVKVKSSKMPEAQASTGANEIFGRVAELVKAAPGTGYAESVDELFNAVISKHEAVVLAMQGEKQKHAKQDSAGISLATNALDGRQTGLVPGLAT